MPGAVTATRPGSAGPAPDPSRIEVRELRSFDPAAIDPGSWNDLVARSGGSVYQTWEWQSSWWEAFGSGRLLRLLLCLDKGSVVAVAPLFADERKPGRLRFVGSGMAFSASPGLFLDDGPSDYLDLIADPAHAGAASRALAERLGDPGSGVERLDLVNLPGDGPGVRHLLPALEARGGFRVTRFPGDVCSRVTVGPPTEEFVRGLDGSVRRRYLQASRLLGSGDGALRVRRHGPEDFDAAFGDLVRLHQARWNRAGFTGLFHDAESRRFQERAARALLERGLLWFATLHDGERCVAARLGFAYGDRMYDYLSGFDDASPAARRRPGMALLLLMYGDAREAGLRTLDLLRGEEPYKGELTRDRAALVNATAARGGADGRGVLAAISDAASLAGFLCSREFRLLGVQTAAQGTVKGTARYLGFRAKRFSGKFRRRKDRPSNE